MDGSRQRFTVQRLKRLKEYAWPGNIRELRNVVERLLLLAGGEVRAEDVRLALPVSHKIATTVSGAAAETKAVRLRNGFWRSSGRRFLPNLIGTAGRLRKPPRR